MTDIWKRYWGPERDEYSDRPGIRFLPEHIGWLNPCQRIIDLGCGVGNLVAKLRGSGKSAEGVTYQAREVETAKQKHGIALIEADLHDLPLPDAFFDGMIMWDSLEHCVSPYVALCEARRIVKPGGRGLIFIPGPDWINCRYHIIVPDRAQMIHLFKLSGWKPFEIVDVSTKGQPGMFIYKILHDKAYRPTFER